RRRPRRLQRQQSDDGALGTGRPERFTDGGGSLPASLAQPLDRSGCRVRDSTHQACSASGAGKAAATAGAGRYLQGVPERAAPYFQVKLRYRSASLHVHPCRKTPSSPSTSMLVANAALRLRSFSSVSCSFFIVHSTVSFASLWRTNWKDARFSSRPSSVTRASMPTQFPCLRPPWPV